MLASSFRKFETPSSFSYPLLQLIPLILFLLFHKTERTPFIPNPIRPPLLFPLPLLCIREPCSLSPLFLSRVAILLIWVWKLVWNLNYILILLPLPLFCSDVNYVWLSLIYELFYDMLISPLPFSTTRFRSWYESESHPAFNSLPFFADYRRPSDEAITLYRNLISFLRCLGLNSVSITVFSCILYIVKINVIPARSTV